MKLNTKALGEELAFIRQASKTRAVMPILTTVLVDAREGRATLRMTDLDLWLTTSLECEAKEPLRFCVTAAWLAEAATGDGELSLALAKNGQLTIKSGSRTSSLPTLPPEDFPEWPTMGELGLELDLKSTDAETFALAMKAVSVEQEKFILTCPWLMPDGHLIGTNGKILARLPLVPEGLDVDAPLSMPVTMPWLALAAGGEQMALECDATMTRVSCGQREAIAKRIDGVPPNFQHFAPALFHPDGMHWAEVEREELTDALRFLAPHADEGRNMSAKFSFAETGLTVFHESDSNGTREIGVASKGKGEPVVMLGIAQALKALASLPEGELCIGVMGDASQALFVVGDSRCLQVAVR